MTFLHPITRYLGDTGLIVIGLFFLWAVIQGIQATAQPIHSEWCERMATTHATVQCIVEELN